MAKHTPNWAEAPEGATHFNTRTGRYYRLTSDLRHSRAQAQVFQDGSWNLSQFTNADMDTDERFVLRLADQNTQPTQGVVFTMSEQEAKSLALDARPMKVVRAKYNNSTQAKQYDFWAPADTKTGDYAVVHQASHVQGVDGFPFTVVQITQDEVVDTSRATRAILGTFNEDFAKYVQARIEHMARVKAKLEAKKKAFEEQAFYQMLAERDPEARALLEELKQFQ